MNLSFDFFSCGEGGGHGIKLQLSIRIFSHDLCWLCTHVSCYFRRTVVTLRTWAGTTAWCSLAASQTMTWTLRTVTSRSFLRSSRRWLYLRWHVSTTSVPCSFLFGSTSCWVQPFWWAITHCCYEHILCDIEYVSSAVSSFHMKNSAITKLSIIIIAVTNSMCLNLIWERPTLCLFVSAMLEGHSFGLL